MDKPQPPKILKVILMQMQWSVSRTKIDGMYYVLICIPHFLCSPFSLSKLYILTVTKTWAWSWRWHYKESAITLDQRNWKKIYGTIIPISECMLYIVLSLRQFFTQTQMQGGRFGPPIMDHTKFCIPIKSQLQIVDYDTNMLFCT